MTIEPAHGVLAWLLEVTIVEWFRHRRIMEQNRSQNRKLAWLITCLRDKGVLTPMQRWRSEDDPVTVHGVRLPKDAAQANPFADEPTNPGRKR